MIRLLRGFAVLLAALVALGAAGTGFIETPWGKAWLASELSRQLSTPAERVSIAGLSGTLPFDTQIESIVVADSAGPQLTIDDVHLAISGRQLLRGQLAFTALHVRSIDMARPSEDSLSPAALINPPLPVTLDGLAIDRLSLGEPVLGAAMTLRVRGSFELHSGRANAAFAIRQSDGDASADLRLAYDGTRLGVTATATEPAGTLMQAILKSAGPLPLDLHVTGSGPLDDWRGDASLAVGSAASAQFAVSVAGDEPHHLTLAGTANVAALLPEKLRSLAQGAVAVDAEADVGTETIALDRLALSGPMRLFARGTYAWGSGAIGGRATFALDDVAPLALLLDRPLSGSATLVLDLGGTLDAPEANAVLNAASLETPGLGLAAAHAALHAAREGDSQIALSGRGVFSGIAAAALPPDMARSLAWRFAGRLDTDAESLTLDRFTADDAGASLEAKAAASPAGVSGTLDFTLADLAQFDGGSFAGRLEASAGFHAGADGAGSAVVSGALLDPHGAGQIDALLGPKVAFAATIERQPDGALAAHDATLDATGAQMSASATRDANGQIAADFSASVPRLALLDPEVVGAVTAKARIEGPEDALHAVVTLDAPHIDAYGRPIDAAHAQLDLPRLSPAHGRIVSTMRVAGLPLEVSANGALDGRSFALDHIALSSAGARLDGSIKIAGSAIAGSLDGTAPDLAPFSKLAGVRLAGRASLEGRIAGNRYDAVAQVTGLGAASATAERVRLAASVIDPFVHPQGGVTLVVAGGAMGDVRLDRAELVAHVEAPARYAITLSAAGTTGEPFSLGANASVGFNQNGATELRVAKLDGELGRAPVKLTQPLIFAWRAGAAQFSGLALEAGGGSLTGDGALEPGGRIALHLLAKDLSLHALAGIADKEAEGALGFEANISGTRRAPQGKLVVDGEGVRFAPRQQPNMPAVGLVMSLDWHAGRVDVAGRLAGPQGGAIGWNGSVPLAMPATGFVPFLPRDGAVAFRLEGNGDLAPVADLLPLGDDRLAGKFAVELSVDGTVGAPDAKGRLTVTGARYENILTGAVLDGLDFALVGNRDRLVLEDFSANDGGKGTLRLKGAVDLAASPLPKFELDGQLSHFRAMRRDEGTATASGTFTLAGSVAAPVLRAAITIDEADLSVPERLAPALQPVPVVKIDSATGTTVSATNQPAAPSPLETLALDVTVTLPGKTFVRGRGLDSEWRGKVTVQGTSHAPILKGQLDVVQGTYNFVGVTFVLSKGAISFTGGNKIDPAVAIEATAQSTGVTAIVDISGTATQPTIKLSSEPALPRDEILARVLFGTSMSQISPTEGLQLASAAASLAGGQSLDVLGKLRRGLGLDRLALGAAPSSVVPGMSVPSLSSAPGDPGSDPAPGLGTTPLAPGSTTAGSVGSSGGAAVSAGKYVTKGVYVGVTQGMGTNSSTVNVEVDVSRHITVETQAGQEAGTGIGVNWKLDY
jgi:translocation and assembly module TamB